MDGFWYIPEGDGPVSQSGVDYGNGSKPIRVVARRSDHDKLAYVVVKIPGGKHWAGNHMPQVSHPGDYHVLRILEQTAPGLYRCEDLMEFPLRN